MKLVDYSSHEKYISEKILSQLKNKKIGITGVNGFLGRNWTFFFDYLNANFGAKIEIFGFDLMKEMDSFYRGMLTYEQMDVSKTFSLNTGLDFMIHAASIASPPKYREFPLETIHANIWGTENVLQLAKLGQIKKVVLLSTSEIYGNPNEINIPTAESYKGNVSYAGPRACYDESKRLVETLNWIYYQYFGVETLCIRPFNVYGPGQDIADGRIIPDIIKSIVQNKKFSLRSDGTPTRTYCYISDFIVGSVMCMIYGSGGEGYNIGNSEPEISVAGLVETFNSVLLENDIKAIEVIQEKSRDLHYLTDNPQRRCPDISKMASLCDWTPLIPLKSGVRATLMSYLDNIVL